METEKTAVLPYASAPRKGRLARRQSVDFWGNQYVAWGLVSAFLLWRLLASIPLWAVMTRSYRVSLPEVSRIMLQCSELARSHGLVVAMAGWPLVMPFLVHRITHAWSRPRRNACAEWSIAAAMFTGVAILIVTETAMYLPFIHLAAR